MAHTVCIGGALLAECLFGGNTELYMFQQKLMVENPSFNRCCTITSTLEAFCNYALYKSTSDIDIFIVVG